MSYPLYLFFLTQIKHSYIRKIDASATGTTKPSSTSTRSSVSDIRTGKIITVETKVKKVVEDADTSIIMGMKVIFSNRAFIYGTLMATSVWVCMSLPLSVVGLAMSNAGISNDYILGAFITHFLGMFLPGFISGKLMLALGYAAVGLFSTFAYTIGGICNIFASSNDPTLWIIGQFFVGVAWNLGFSTSSVMISTCTMPGQVKLAAKTQSYSDFISFFCGGLITISAGFMYEHNIKMGLEDSMVGIDGWRMLNYISFLFIGIMLVCIIVMWYDGGGSSSRSEDNAVEDKPWRHGSSLSSQAPSSISLSESLFLGRGSFYDRNAVENLEEDAERQDE